MSRMKVTVVEGRVRVATVGIQGPAGSGGATYEYVDAADTASRARANHTGTQPSSTISDFPMAVDARVGIQKGAANGLATLGSDGKVPTAQLPANTINTVASVNGRTGTVTGLAEDSAAVHSTGAETVAGVKTFSSSPVIPTPTDSTDAANKSYVDLAASSATTPDADAATKGKIQLAGDLGGTAANPTTPTAVHVTGDEPVSGVKTFASSPTVPTPTTSGQAATKGYVDTSVSNLVASAPGTLDTLKELADALGDDANFAATTATALGQKLTKALNLSDLSSASAARTNLGVAIGIDVQAYNASLTALGALGATGLMAQTSAGAYVARSIVAGSASVTVINGNGVAGHPTIDVAAATFSTAGKVLQTFYNVRDPAYAGGAVGDGSTNDTAAFVAASAAAVAGGGGTIFIGKPGTYVVDSEALQVTSNVWWDAVPGVKIEFTARVGIFRGFIGNGSSGTHLSNIRVSNIFFSGVRSAALGTAPHSGTFAFGINYLDDFVFENCQFEQFEIDVSLDNSRRGDLNRLKDLSGTTTYGSKDLIQIKGCRELNINNCIHYGNDTALRIAGCHRLSIQGNKFYTSSIEISNAQGYGPSTDINIIGNYLEDAPVNLVTFGDASDAPTDVISVEGYDISVEGVNIIGNEFVLTSVTLLTGVLGTSSPTTKAAGTANVNVTGNKFRATISGALKVTGVYAQQGNGVALNWNVANNNFSDMTGTDIFINNGVNFTTHHNKHINFNRGGGLGSPSDRSAVSIQANSSQPSSYVYVEDEIMDGGGSSFCLPVNVDTDTYLSNVYIRNNSIRGFAGTSAGPAIRFAANVPTGQVSNNIGFNPVRLYAQGNVTGATTFNRLNGSLITSTLTGNITITLTAGKIVGDTLRLLLTQDATGGRTASWSGNAVLQATYTLNTAASAIDSIEFAWDGTNWVEIGRDNSTSSTGFVDLTTAQNVGGVKLFTSRPVFNAAADSGFQLKLNGTSKGYMVVPTSAGSFSSDSAGSDLVIRVEATSQKILFNGDGGSTGSTLAIVTTSGAKRVGINTANPSTTLEVNGTATATTFAGSGASLTNLPESALSSAVAIARGGTGQTTAAAGFNALSPMTTAGDVIYGGTSGAGTRLAAGTSSQVLIGGTTPSWGSVALASMVSGQLPIANGGTGSATQNFLDLTTAQTKAGALTLSTQGILDSTSNPGFQYKTSGTSRGYIVAPTSTAGFSSESAVGDLVVRVESSSAKIIFNTNAGGAGAFVINDAYVQFKRTPVYPVAFKTANYNLTTTDFDVRADATSGGITQTLPDATTYTGRTYRILKVDSSANAVTIATTSSQTINGSSTFTLGIQWDWVEVRSNSANWEVVSTNVVRSLSLIDAANVVLGITTGTKIGTATTQKLGLWNVTPVVQPAGANQAAITDSTGGTAGFTLSDVTASHSQSILNNNFASINRQLDAFRTALVAAGVIKGAA